MVPPSIFASSNHGLPERDTRCSLVIDQWSTICQKRPFVPAVSLSESAPYHPMEAATLDSNLITPSQHHRVMIVHLFFSTASYKNSPSASASCLSASVPSLPQLSRTTISWELGSAPDWLLASWRNLCLHSDWSTATAGPFCTESGYGEERENVAWEQLAANVLLSHV